MRPTGWCWLDDAGTRGIDAAMDLSVRPWGIAGAGAIVGVFEAGRKRPPGCCYDTGLDGRSPAALTVSYRKQ